MAKLKDAIDRKQRLAEALRQNLKRRKAQGRQRTAAATHAPTSDRPQPGRDNTD